LLDAAKERARKLELSLKAQEFFFEAEEVESWLTEKNDRLQSTDYGRDRDAASKLLAKHKALELELDTYNGIITEMGHSAEKMVGNLFIKNNKKNVINILRVLFNSETKSLSCDMLI